MHTNPRRGAGLTHALLTATLLIAFVGAFGAASPTVLRTTVRTVTMLLTGN